MQNKRRRVCVMAVLVTILLIVSACGKQEKAPIEESGQKEEEVQKQEEDTNPQETVQQEELSPEELREMWVQECISKMTIEEKVAQMFIPTLDALTGVENTAEAGMITRQRFQTFPVGGVIMMGGNIQSETQITDLNTELESISRDRVGVIPFLCVDEEGGTVTRVAGNPAFPVQDVGDMRNIGATGDVSQAYQAGRQLGEYLSRYSFNVDFAPDADVLLNPDNTVVASRSFGSDPDLVAGMVTETIRGLSEYGICTAVKHFPGHGATTEDSHEGFAYSLRTEEEIRNCELKPFRAGIDAGADFVMVGHISYPNVTGNDTPATVSDVLVNRYLRQELRYDGIAITDAMNMGAIANYYSSGDAAVMAVQAGIDVILMPADFETAYQAVLESVRNGTLQEERIEQSVKRILRVKWEIQEEEDES